MGFFPGLKKFNTIKNSITQVLTSPDKLEQTLRELGASPELIDNAMTQIREKGYASASGVRIEGVETKAGNDSNSNFLMNQKPPNISEATCRYCGYKIYIGEDTCRSCGRRNRRSLLAKFFNK